jgi:hypothetical protein
MSDITIDQVTTTDPTEDGVFDVLMRSVDSHLDKQYVAGRIKGADYATVYLGALQAVLQQSIMFVLSEQKVEKEIELATAQIALVDQQKLSEVQNTRLVDANADKVEYEVLNILPKQALLLDQQKIQLEEQIDLLQSQDLEVIASTIRQDNQSAKELEVKDQQIASMIADDLIKDRQVIVAETQSVKDLEVKTQQIASMVSDDLIKDRQVVVSETQSSKDLEVKDTQIDSLQTDMAVKLEQSEKDLVIKENQALEVLAGTARQDSLADEQIVASNANTALKQVLGEKQADVYEGQAASFDKEAKFKVFKSLLDLRTTGMTQEMPGIKLDSESTGTDGDANSLANFMLKDVGISTDAAPIQNIISNDIIS